jgi:hypothetical protein
MAVNDSYVQTVSGLADAGDLIVDGSATGTGAANVTELFGGDACEVFREVDTNGDGTFNVSETVDTLSSGFHSQNNNLLVSQSQNTRLRIRNKSGGPADFGVVGYEVDN